MKFAHIADCHIGSWRDPKLKNSSTKAFLRAANRCMEQNVDFILIAGDLFNTSFPPLDNLKFVAGKLRELKEKNIPVYLIAGSHDFSPSGKTILSVLEEAGLLKNIFRGKVDENKKLHLEFTVDKKTGAKIAGIIGKKGMLDRKYYEDLVRDELEKEQGFKIFMFHTALEELKPKELERMKAYPTSMMPKNFNYYAGGHIHIVDEVNLDGYKNVVYPGPLFPNNFYELEKLEKGGFYIVNVEENKISKEFIPIQIHNVHKILIPCDGKTPKQVEEDILEQIKNKQFNDTVVLIRCKGTLESGKPSDIDFRNIFSVLYNKSAYFVMKSTSLLKTKEFEIEEIDDENVEDVEKKLIEENKSDIKLDRDEKELVEKLMKALNTEKQEGEKVAEFEGRVKGEVNKILEL